MARGMGMSMGELVKKVSTGSVEAQSALAKLFGEMNRTFGGSALQQMQTFNGQWALLHTNMQRLMTDSGGMQGFFRIVKSSLTEINTLLASPLAMQWSHQFGMALQQLVLVGRSAIQWMIDWHAQIIAVGKLLMLYFVSRTVVSGVMAIALAIGGAAVNAVRGLTAVTFAYTQGAVAELEHDGGLPLQPGRRRRRDGGARPRPGDHDDDRPDRHRRGRHLPARRVSGPVQRQDGRGLGPDRRGPGHREERPGDR
jgi:phage tail tape-measure protein